MATRLDAAASAAATTLAYTVGAGTNRCLIVGVQTEGTQSGNFTCDYGGQTMAHVVQTTAGSGTTQQTTGLFYLNDAGIVAASTNVITPGNTGTPGDLTISARSYEDVNQSTPTNTDTDTTAAATPNPLAALDIVTGAADAVVVAFAGCGNATTTTWGGTVAEQTDQIDASSVGSLGDDEVPSATTIACEPTFASQNRACGVALELAHLASAGITGVVPTEFDMDNADIDVDGSDFEASQTTGTIYLSDANTLAGSANEVDISSAVNTWNDTQINLDLTSLSAGELASLHTLGPGQRFIIVLTSIPNEYASAAITLHRPQAFQMVLGAATPGSTTARLTGLTGTFAGGRIEETAAQNPSTTNTNVADDGNREDVWSLEGKPLAREVSYAFRVLYGGEVADTITQTPNITISASTGFIGSPSTFFNYNWTGHAGTAIIGFVDISSAVFTYEWTGHIGSIIIGVADGATWKAALNIDLTGINVDSNVDLRLRTQIKLTVVEATTPAFKYQGRVNAGSYFDITASSSFIQTFNSAEFVDGDDCDVKLLGGSDTLITNNNAAEDNTGTFTMPVNFTVGDIIESEIAFRLVSADLSNGDDVDIRIVEGDGTVFDTYTQIGSIAVTKAVGTPFIGVQGSIFTYEWTGHIGSMILGFTLVGTTGAYEWTGHVGAIATGFVDVQTSTDNYNWTGHTGSEILGLSFVSATPFDYEWTGHAGSQILGFDAIQSITDNYNWTGFAGIEEIGFIDISSALFNYEWTGHAGIEVLGFSGTPSTFLTYEWTGHAGVGEFGFIDVSGTTDNYNWTGHAGSLVQGSIFVPSVVFNYEWTGFIGLTQIGQDQGFIGSPGAVLTYEWTGQVGIANVGFVDISSSIFNYNWTGYVGTQATGFVGVQSTFDNYNWTGYIGSLTRGYNLVSESIFNYNWTGYDGSIILGTVSIPATINNYNWTGYVGSSIITQELSFIGTPSTFLTYEWTGYVGTEVIGFNDISSTFDNYNWTGYAGIEELGFSGTPSTFLTYEWTGYIGVETLGFTDVSSAFFNYNWTGFIGSIIIDDTSFIGTPSTFLTYEWTGHLGSEIRGYSALTSAATDTYSWTGHIGLVSIGFVQTSTGEDNLEWTGHDGILSIGAVRTPGIVNNYNWTGYVGIVSKGFVSLQPANESNYNWEGYLGILDRGTVWGEQCPDSDNWADSSKDVSSWSDQAKNSDNWGNAAKDSSSWPNETKDSDNWDIESTDRSNLDRCA